MNVMVTGGCGYIGAWLIPHLLADGHKVTCYDTQWFGSGSMPDNGSLTVIKADVRNPERFRLACEGQNAVIYLASISSEEMCQQNKRLAFSVNRAAPTCALISRICGVERFIYASSVAIYGSDNATEKTQPKPTTIYGMGKVDAEMMLPEATIVRSASVCGYSPHQRLDLTVNKMVHDAIRKGVITVNGGEQKRSHVHIKDISDFYKLLLKVPREKIHAQVFNVVAENQAVIETARQVAEVTGAKVEVRPRTDTRSYSVDGRKAQETLGFTPKKKVVHAIRDLKVHFDSGEWKDSETNPVYQNIAHGIS